LPSESEENNAETFPNKNPAANPHKHPIGAPKTRSSVPNQMETKIVLTRAA